MYLPFSVFGPGQSVHERQTIGVRFLTALGSYDSRLIGEEVSIPRFAGCDRVSVNSVGVNRAMFLLPGGIRKTVAGLHSRRQHFINEAGRLRIYRLYNLTYAGISSVGQEQRGSEGTPRHTCSRTL